MFSYRAELGPTISRPVDSRARGLLYITLRTVRRPVSSRFGKDGIVGSEIIKSDNSLSQYIVAKVEKNVQNMPLK